MFAVASFSAQWMLRRDYLPLIRKDPKHRWMLRAWIVIYVFVGIQMGWVLRPFIGDPDVPVQFFRENSWSNAYEVVIADDLGRAQGTRAMRVRLQESDDPLRHSMPSIDPRISSFAMGLTTQAARMYRAMMTSCAITLAEAGAHRDSKWHAGGVVHRTR